MALLACSMAMKIVKRRCSFYSFFPETIFFGTRLEWQFHRNYVPYNCEKKYVLLLMKSDIWLFKVLLLTCQNIFFRNKTFFVFKDRELKLASYWFGILWILTKFQLIWTTFIFLSPCYYLSSNSVINKGCY